MLYLDSMARLHIFDLNHIFIRIKELSIDS